MEAKNEINNDQIIAAIADQMPPITNKEGFIVDNEVDKEEIIFQVLQSIGPAIAKTMKSENDFRVEMSGLFIATLKHVKEQPGRGVADGTNIPEHYRLKIKPHLGMLRRFEKEFGIRVTR